MPLISLTTVIEAPIERVFDLSTSIELHMLSTKLTNERAVAGRTTGKILYGETVTWRAKHVGFYQHLTVKITAYKRPHRFTDEMVKGVFSMMQHTHLFETIGADKTLMTDRFEFKSPLGILGKIADTLFLKSYMRRFLMIRNAEIKRIAESEEWKTLI